jgi:hypothetical protein
VLLVPQLGVPGSLDIGDSRTLGSRIGYGKEAANQKVDVLLFVTWLEGKSQRVVVIGRVSVTERTTSGSLFKLQVLESENYSSSNGDTVSTVFNNTVRGGCHVFISCSH